MESRHPLSPGGRRLRDTVGLRYLSFGSSFTYGVGLSQPTEEAYPFLLSQDTRNVATRRVGYELAAACTQSIVGDDMYDVITIEAGRIDESTRLLVSRLRQRFPDSMILLLRPQEASGTFVGGIDGASNGAPIIAQPRSETDEMALHDLSRDSGSQILTFSTLNGGGEMHSLSTMHKILSKAVLDATRSAPRVTSLGSWGSGDKCELWYSHGMANPSLLTHEFGHDVSTDEHKHAVEVHQPLSITVLNPFASPRMLYLTYMTSKAELDDDGNPKIFPKIRVYMNGLPTVEVEPVHTMSSDSSFVRTSAVGMVSPGSCEILLKPLSVAALPLRLVGVSFLAEEAAHLPLEFDLDGDEVPLTSESWL